MKIFPYTKYEFLTADQPLKLKPLSAYDKLVFRETKRGWFGKLKKDREVVEVFCNKDKDHHSAQSPGKVYMSPGYFTMYSCDGNRVERKKEQELSRAWYHARNCEKIKEKDKIRKRDLRANWNMPC
jgi:hypothetical protein